MLATGGWTQTGMSVALLGAYALPYALRARTLDRRGRPVARWRLACFAAALLVLAVAVSPAVDTLADERLSMHMVEHLLIGDIAPLLVVLGLTGPMLAPLLHNPVAARLRSCTHPVVAVALWALSLYLWHLRVAYEAAVESDLVHVLQHLCFFAFGANLWLALLGPLPKPAWFTTTARLVYVLVMWLVGAALANALLWADTGFYPWYARTASAAGRSASADQSTAGGVMLVEQTVVVVCLLGWLLWRVIREAGERQALIELAAARGVAVEERRIARAVGADRGDDLARRITESSSDRFAE